MDMSEPEESPSTSGTQMVSAEYKDGPLQIVEVRPFDKEDAMLDTDMASLEDLDVNEQTKYVQLVTDVDRPLMQLDLLNLTLVRYDDGTEGFRLVTNGEEVSDDGSNTVTCVLAAQAPSDNEESQVPQDSFVVYEDQNTPFMYLQAEIPQQQNPEPQTPEAAPEPAPDTTNKIKLSPDEILERAKQVQKAKSLQLISKPWKMQKSRSRKIRKSDLPPPHELLASPNFRLFLYSCKLCNFKCNAIKEMTAHKTAQHSPGTRCRRPTPIMLQCAQCPYRGASHAQLMSHVQSMHIKESNKVYLNTSEVEAADVLVCGACGFESSVKEEFRHHIEKEHGATTC